MVAKGGDFLHKAFLFTTGIIRRAMLVIGFAFGFTLIGFGLAEAAHAGTPPVPTTDAASDGTLLGLQSPVESVIGLLRGEPLPVDVNRLPAPVRTLVEDVSTAVAPISEPATPVTDTVADVLASLPGVLPDSGVVTPVSPPPLSHVPAYDGGSTEAVSEVRHGRAAAVRSAETAMVVLRSAVTLVDVRGAQPGIPPAESPDRWLQATVPVTTGASGPPGPTAVLPWRGFVAAHGHWWPFSPRSLIPPSAWDSYGFNHPS